MASRASSTGSVWMGHWPVGLFSRDYQGAAITTLSQYYKGPSLASGPNAPLERAICHDNEKLNSLSEVKALNFWLP